MRDPKNFARLLEKMTSGDTEASLNTTGLYPLKDFLEMRLHLWRIRTRNRENSENEISLGEYYFTDAITISEQSDERGYFDCTDKKITEMERETYLYISPAKETDKERHGLISIVEYIAEPKILKRLFKRPSLPMFGSPHNLNIVMTYQEYKTMGSPRILSMYSVFEKLH
jgi:hypothetical protein